ncbi:hypothetical protein F2Q70_00002308 [Brassica cretica]|uniref:Uncharacterized protein n=1 Tax=Brassica cretica TaxID=69181 RepID=A0A3N6R170_BRACR|nr:hypothetical protein F2Q70_00002308 [Brassica cretica]KAF3568723.1 hypothetical protein DY000_02013712 [Brassica cretica]
MQQLYPKEGKINRKLKQRRLRSGSRDVRDRTRPGKDPGEKPSSSPRKGTYRRPQPPDDHRVGLFLSERYRES